MPINPVTTSSASAALQIQQPKAEKQNQAAQESERAKTADQTRQAERPRDRPVEKAPEVKAPEQPKPVVNTQGQTTGKVINVTA